MFTDAPISYDRARRYREKAAELKSRAADTPSDVMREALLQAADSFDVLSRAAIRQAQWTRRAHELLIEVEAYAAAPALKGNDG